MFYMPQIYEMGPTALLPLRRKACWGFFHPKNLTASAGFEPVNLGTKGQHATPRPLKPIYSKQMFVVLTYTSDFIVYYKISVSVPCTNEWVRNVVTGLETISLPFLTSEVETKSGKCGWWTVTFIPNLAFVCWQIQHLCAQAVLFCVSIEKKTN